MRDFLSSRNKKERSGLFSLVCLAESHERIGKRKRFSHRKGLGFGQPRAKVVSLVLSWVAHVCLRLFIAFVTMISLMKIFLIHEHDVSFFEYDLSNISTPFLFVFEDACVDSIICMLTCLV